MTILRNFWVTKRYRAIDDKWMLFYWGFQEINMLNALERASKKSHLELGLQEDSEAHWRATDPVTDTHYTVEMRDSMPTPPDGVEFSIRDQTIPPNSERKAMPKPGSLFGSSFSTVQLDLL